MLFRQLTNLEIIKDDGESRKPKMLIYYILDHIVMYSSDFSDIYNYNWSYLFP